MVGNGSQFIVNDGGASALGVGFREADLRPWKTVSGKRLRVRRRRWTGSSAAYEVVDEADALWWTSALWWMSALEGEEHEGCGAVEKSILRWG